MGNLIERNQQRKEKRVNILMCILERLSSARAEECPHEFVEVSTQVRRRSFIFCREFGLLHLSRTKRRNWKFNNKGGARSFASGRGIIYIGGFRSILWSGDLLAH